MVCLVTVALGKELLSDQDNSDTTFSTTQELFQEILVHDQILFFQIPQNTS